MEENDFAIVPGERIGPYRLDWDVETLIKHLPEDYSVEEGKYHWCAIFGYYIIGVRKIDQAIDYITLQKGPGIEFKEKFKGKLIGNYTFGEIEEEFGETKSWTWYFTLPNDPGMELYFEDEEESDINDEDDERWKDVKIDHLAVVDPNFIWDERFSAEDYAKVRRNECPCPFPQEKVIFLKREGLDAQK